MEKKKNEGRLEMTKINKYIEKKEKKYYNFEEMIRIVRKCKLDGLNLNIYDKKDNGEFVVLYENKKYFVTDKLLRGGHRYGDGGEIEFFTFLKDENGDIIVTRKFKNYETYLDDSMDYDGDEFRDTYLIKEDCFARRVFSKM